MWPFRVGRELQMQLIGAILALLGTALIVFAAIQAATAMLGDSLLVAVSIGAVGGVLLAAGGWMMLHESRPKGRPWWP
jgi:hypothetical protein